MGFNDLNNAGGGGPGTSGYGPVPTPLYRVLDTDGDGTGTTNANGNYSSSAGVFYIQPPAGQIYRIERMMIYIASEKGKIHIDTYVNAAALSTGINVKKLTGVSTVVTDYTNGIPIKDFGGWARVAFDVNFLATNESVSHNTVASARWTFSKAGYPLRLIGDNSDRLVVTLNDDFSTGGYIDQHYFMVQGYIEETT